MNIIEDNFEIFLETNGGLHVGRFTTNDGRIIYGYLPNSKITEKFHLEDSYFRDIELTFENDPDHKRYFDFLCPNEIEQQIVEDGHVLLALLEKKDDLKTPREIFHYLYFSNLNDQKLFESFAISKGFKITQTEPPNEDNKCLLVISHQDAPERISSTTTYLVEEAKIFNGEYDGWETQIVECQ
jgi:regulator of RNase E activity RraB